MTTPMGGNGSRRPGEQSCDVLVVGGGPTGLLLAALLAQRDVEVVVLERRHEPSVHSRAIGVHPPALLALRAVGLEEAALAEGKRITGGAARSRGRSLGRLSFERAWPERPFVLALPQSRTEELLAQHVTELESPVLRRGREVLAVEEHGDSAVVTARHDDVGGAIERWRARVVVGADGARSTVRELAGIGSRLRPYPDRYLMGDVADLADGNTATIHLEPGGVVESFPLPGAQRRWVVHTGTAPGASSPAELAQIVRDRTGEEIDPDSATMISAFAVRRRTARRMVEGRQVLIGDAAHEVSPIGGQGMTLGWLDALELAPLLDEILAQGTEQPLETLPRFRSFERARLRTARAAGRLAHVNMALGRALPAPVALGRDLALRSVLGSPLRHRLARAYTMAWARP